MNSSGVQRIKKSYSLSREAENFVRKYRKSHKISSDSAALNRLLLKAKAAERVDEVGAAYKAYYDSATEEHLREENEWAALAEREFAQIEL